MPLWRKSKGLFLKLSECYEDGVPNLEFDPFPLKCGRAKEYHAEKVDPKKDQQCKASSCSSTQTPLRPKFMTNPPTHEREL